MTLADIAVIVLLMTNVLAVAYGAVWRNRAANLAVDCERKDAIMQHYLRESDKMLANLASIEGYNASLERQIAELRCMAASNSEIVQIVTRRRKVPELN